MLAACGARLPSGIELSSDQALIIVLDRGRARYVERCGGCHSLVAPADYQPGEWPDEVRHMAKRAKLDAAGADLIVGYLITASRWRPSPAGGDPSATGAH